VRFRLDRQIYGVQQPATGNDEIFQVAEGGITAPRIVSRVAPTYPEEVRKAKIGGTVVLFVEITTSGTVTNVVVLQGLGKGLDESAVSAMKQWKFAPATKDGRPVAVMMTVEMNYSTA
jgi:protein TonB